MMIVLILIYQIKNVLDVIAKIVDALKGIVNVFQEWNIVMLIVNVKIA